jgi:menaquinone-dependent protoporphyrinogen IX oxidase
MQQSYSAVSSSRKIWNIIGKKINPQDTVVFHGNLDLTKLTLAELMIVNSYGGPLGDYRQWNKVQAWADNIAANLAETQANSATSV